MAGIQGHSEAGCSPTTPSGRYALSADRFHWQSQSTTSATSPTGQRYIHDAERGHTLLLFVREEKERNGLACPYDFLGPVAYEHHTGSRPTSVIWRLRHPMPARLLAVARRMAVA